jgi:flagellar biosynthesis/type III secretory pathway M-ring protein FliF/YscJ
MTDVTSWHPVALLGIVFSIVSVILGFAVAYIAVRGYLRNAQRPMLFIAVGFVLVCWTPVVSLVGLLSAAVEPLVFENVAIISQTLGLLSILYGLWMPREVDSSNTA